MGNTPSQPDQSQHDDASGKKKRKHASVPRVTGAALERPSIISPASPSEQSADSGGPGSQLRKEVKASQQSAVTEEATDERAERSRKRKRLDEDEEGEVRSKRKQNGAVVEVEKRWERERVTKEDADGQYGGKAGQNGEIEDRAREAKRRMEKIGTRRSLGGRIKEGGEVEEPVVSGSHAGRALREVPLTEVDVPTGELLAHMKEDDKVPGGEKSRKSKKTKEHANRDGGMSQVVDEVGKEPTSSIVGREHGVKTPMERRKTGEVPLSTQSRHRHARSRQEVPYDVVADPSKTQSSLAQEAVATQAIGLTQVAVPNTPEKDVSVQLPTTRTRGLSHVAIPATQLAPSSTAAKPGTALSTPAYERSEKGVRHSDPKRLQPQLSSEGREPKRHKKSSKSLNETSTATEVSPIQARQQRSSPAQHEPHEKHVVTSTWTTVNGHTRSRTETEKHVEPLPQQAETGSALKVSAVSKAPALGAKHKKTIKSKEFVDTDSDQSHAEGASGQDNAKARARQHKVASPPEQRESKRSKSEARNRRHSNTENNEERNHQTIPYGEMSPRINKRKRKAERSEDYDIPSDNRENEEPHRSFTNSTKRARVKQESARYLQNNADVRQHSPVHTTLGPFTADEIAILTQYFERYRADHAIDQTQMNALIHNTSSDQRSEAKAFWDLIAEHLPLRPRKSIQKFCRRRWHNFQNNGLWMPEEDERLRQAYQFKPNKWVYIAGLVGRRPDDCRDRWRNVVKLSDTRMAGKWETQETDDLRRVVQECVEAMKTAREENSRLGEDGVDSIEEMRLIDWNVVSQKMGGRRSRWQCMDKWKRITQDQSVKKPKRVKKAAAESEELEPLGSKTTRAARRYDFMLPGDKHDIIKAVKESGTVNEGTFRWPIVKRILGGDACVWVKRDVKYALSEIKKQAGVEDQALGLKATFKRMNKWLKDEFGKKALRNRFVDTEEGSRVMEFGWSQLEGERGASAAMSDEEISESDHEGEGELGDAENDEAQGREERVVDLQQDGDGVW